MKIKSPSVFIGNNDPEVISFGAGQPDLPPPEEVVKIHQSCFKYGLIQGELSLRQKLEQLHKVSAENFVITNGASEGVFLALATLIKPGDKVLLTKPYYYSYVELVKIVHGIPIFTDLREGQINLTDFEDKVKDAKLALINSPMNPTGVVLNENTIRKIERLANANKKYLLFDEVYDNLIYEGKHYSPRGDYILNINSFSKTFSMCGFRIGYVYSNNANIIKDIIEHKTHSSMNTNRTAQEMAEKALNVPKRFVEERLNIWKKRRDIIYEGLKKLGLEVWVPNGAYYVFPRFANASQAVEDLYFNYKVITYKGEWFGSPNRIRLSYATDKKNIIEGLRRIEQYLKNKPLLL